MHQPKDRDELKQLIVDCYEGKLYLQDIDISLITDMNNIFNFYYFEKRYNIDINKIWENSNNDISKWNTSNVTNMYGMFYYSEFNGDISKWDTSNVDSMSWMFFKSNFNKDLSLWMLSLNPNVKLYMFNFNSEHEVVYGGINSYKDFIKTVKWDNIKPYIKEMIKNSSNSKRYELLKRLNSIEHITDIDDIDIK